MDKNSIIGFSLIALVVVAFSVFNRPKKTDQLADKAAAPQKIETTTQAPGNLQAEESSPIAETVPSPDSTALFFAASQARPAQELTLANNMLEVKLSTQGGTPVSAELKEYKTYAGQPLMLYTPQDSRLQLLLRTQAGILETSKLFFRPIEQTQERVVLRLDAAEDAYLDFIYELASDDYRLAWRIEGKGLSKIFPSNMRYLDLEMEQKLRLQEKSWDNENLYSSLYYKYNATDDVDALSSQGSNKEKELSESLSWVAFKGKFFSTTLIADSAKPFERTQLKQKALPKGGSYVKDCQLVTTLPFSPKEGETVSMTMYMGPLEHYLLKGYDENVADKSQRWHLEKLVNVGGSLLRFINLYLILPLVSFLSRFISNWGIIILLLTLIIKLVLSPLTFKSYLSQAKMRVLKPQVEAINKKYPGQEQQMMMKRSQETMQLYRMAGASPLSGCMPMLLQMPFLIALYRFFPTAIYLRGERFLWAEDLSSFDDVISWGTHIPLVGDHISLFCLLWAVTNILYSHYTMSQSATGQDNQQMKMMKWMPYIMSIMFFGFFNNNASGLCYYYFLSTLITILQFVASRFLINEEKLLARLEENKKKPRKKSGFMARLEEAQRKQQQYLQEQQKKQRR